MFKLRRNRSDKPTQRRRYERFPSGTSRGTCSAGEIALVDVSPMGLGFSSARDTGLSPGDRHLVIVEDHRGRSFESLAEIRWSVGPSSRGRYRAGLAFVAVLRDEPGGCWSGVTSDPTVETGESNAWASDLASPAADRKLPSVLRLDAFRRRRKARFR